MTRYALLSLLTLALLFPEGAARAGDDGGWNLLPGLLAQGTDQVNDSTGVVHEPGVATDSTGVVPEPEVAAGGTGPLAPIPVYKPVLFSAVIPGSGQLYRGRRGDSPTSPPRW
jgi:hypothetical protein